MAAASKRNAETAHHTAQHHPNPRSMPNGAKPWFVDCELF
jgi:hypothetical protein